MKNKLSTQIKLHLLSIGFCLLSLQSCHTCPDPIPSPCYTRSEVFKFVEEMPQFPGGIDSMSAFIKTNLRYPEKSKQAKIEGSSTVQFVVNPFGYLECIKISTSLNDECDAEAIRLMNSMPFWKPGKHNSNNVAVSFTLQIEFKL